MNNVSDPFDKLINAEDYLDFFGIVFDPSVVHVNRLHILKKFSLAKREIDQENPGISPEGRWTLYRDAMIRAYETFLTSTAPEQRLFKVFQQPPPGWVTIGDSEQGVGSFAGMTFRRNGCESHDS